MTAAGNGLWRVTVPDAGPGTDYGFLLDGGRHPAARPARALAARGRARAEPRLRHAALRLARQRLDRPRSCAGAVLYELHVGTFTPEGTFDAAVESSTTWSSSASTWSS